MSRDYWGDRVANAHSKLTNKNIKEVEKQLRKYYRDSMSRTIKDFEDTYNHLFNTIEDGREPTPADLYKLDKYWVLQGKMKKELQKLGDKQASKLSRIFETNFFEVYYSWGKKSNEAWSTLDTEAVKQMINSIWCADGKSWSERIWENTQKLASTLNEGLISCVAAGRKTSDLKKVLQERFSVSYSQADSLVRTELAHIQTEAAKKRYEDYGIQKVQIWADKDERRCEVCGKLHEKVYNLGEQIPIPAHPRCRCCIIPVVE